MNLIRAWKKVLAFGLLGAMGCMLGWAVGFPLLDVIKSSRTRSVALPRTQPPPIPDFTKEMRDRTEGAGGKSGEIEIQLEWYDKNDLDLWCVEPDYNTILHYKPKDGPNHRLSKKARSQVERGWKDNLDVDAKADCHSSTEKNPPLEHIRWRTGENAEPEEGTYTVYVDFYKRCPGQKEKSEFTVTIKCGIDTVREYKDVVEYSDVAMTSFPGFKDGVKKDKHHNEKKVCEFVVQPKAILFAPTDIRVYPGTQVRIPVTVRTAFFKGKPDVEAIDLPSGVSFGGFERLTTKDNDTYGEILLNVSADASSNELPISFITKGVKVPGLTTSKLSIQVEKFSIISLLATAGWTALLAVGLAFSLFIGQNRYLHRPWLSGGNSLRIGAGAATSGIISGCVGQVLFFILISVGIPETGFIFGWIVLGGFLGWGVSFFIPNLDKKRAAVAGIIGGTLGSLIFIIVSQAQDYLGSLSGGVVLGFCIGSMVAAVEAMFRDAVLEVRFSGGETIEVNLGPEWVKAGGDDRQCAIWIRGADPVALRFCMRDGQVVCDERSLGKERILGNGARLKVNQVEMIVRSSGSTHDPDTPPLERSPIRSLLH
jgi:hypothetical protein